MLRKKKFRSSLGELEIDVPQDRESTFEPQITKNSRRIFLT